MSPAVTADRDFWHITRLQHKVTLGAQMKVTHRTKIILWVGISGLVLAALGTALWIRHFRRYTPAEVMQDVRAGIAARNDPRPVERFLELRYGPLTDPANRQKAFLDFFNVGHIQGLQLLVSHMPASKRQARTEVMAQWIAEYRNTMSPEEKESLNTYLHTEPARKTLQQATSQYLSQDVHYRAASLPVIEELMATLAAVQKP